jgi:hypothetical protein
MGFRAAACVGLFAFTFFADTPVARSSPATGLVEIRNDKGGVVIDYAMRVLQLRKEGTSVRVSGRCMSACTLHLSLPENQICITRGAAFGFHLPYGASDGGNRTARDFLYRNYPSWVKAWLEAQGGLSRGMKVMSYRVASRYLKTCPGRTAGNAGLTSDRALY